MGKRLISTKTKIKSKSEFENKDFNLEINFLIPQLNAVGIVNLELGYHCRIWFELKNNNI